MRSLNVNRLRALLIIASLGFGSLSAHSKKTFLMPRAIGMNKTMEFSPWDANLHDMSKKNFCIHSRINVTPFYQHSADGDDTGEYFGIGNCKNSFTVGNRLFWICVQ